MPSFSFHLGRGLWVSVSQQDFRRGLEVVTALTGKIKQRVLGARSGSETPLAAGTSGAASSKLPERLVCFRVKRLLSSWLSNS